MMVNANVMIITEEGIAHLVQANTDEIEALELTIAEHFGSGCNWQVLSENQIRLGWQ